MTHDESGLDEFHPDTSHNASPKVAPVLWLDIVETKPVSLDTWCMQRDLPSDHDISVKAYGRYLDRFQPFRLVLKSAGNNEILMHGESYFNREKALHTARLIGSAGTTVYLRQPEHGNETLRLGVVDNGGKESDTGEGGADDAS